jgi:hypothetical protein
MTLSIVERMKGFLLSPSKTFDTSKEDTLGDAFKYFVVILVIYAVLVAIIAAVAFALFGGMFGMFGVPWMPFRAAMGPLVAVAVLIGALVVGIIGVFIRGLWIHLWVYLVGGRNGLEQTIKAVMYGDTPVLLLGWIPIFNVIAGIWTLIVSIIGIRQLHGLSTGKAVLAVIIAIIIPAIIIGAMLVFGGPMYGPRFRGY